MKKCLFIFCALGIMQLGCGGTSVDGFEKCHLCGSETIICPIDSTFRPQSDMLVLELGIESAIEAFRIEWREEDVRKAFANMAIMWGHFNLKEPNPCGKGSFASACARPGWSVSSEHFKNSVYLSPGFMIDIRDGHEITRKDDFYSIPKEFLEGTRSDPLTLSPSPARALIHELVHIMEFTVDGRTDFDYVPREGDFSHDDVDHRWSALTKYGIQIWREKVVLADILSERESSD